MKEKLSPAAKLEIIRQLMYKEEDCICEKCGDKHIHVSGLLKLSKEEFQKLLNSELIEE